ncbi:Uncharacterised protein [Enterococcus hirae]|uniref:hypothetical protein n=1 Tax=Enterococcus hirae TaxID=1354 RepID=UPI00102545D8|nr:hypothetical protein [Enterococcus hirae]VFA57516.1 Uncharacterised protein [Enterococcus hirae]VTS66964.1 Uncharacterised protein [Enterococcus hirae]
MKKEWIKFHGEHDFLTVSDADNVSNFIQKFLLNAKVVSLNEAIEVYNVLQFINSNYFKENHPNDVMNFNSLAHKVLNDYFNSGDLSKYIEEYTDLYFQYESDFWNIFVAYRIIKKTDFSSFEKCIKEKDVAIHYLLEHKKIVEKYKIFLKNELLSNPRHFELFIDKYDSPTPENIYLPNNFSEEEITDWARRYCELEESNVNYLERISNWSLHHERKLDARIISKAKREIKKQTEKFFSVSNSVSSKLAVGLQSGLADDFYIDSNPKKLEIIFNKDWLEGEQDYPTILNNFLHFFGVFNPVFQFSLIESPYDYGGVLDLIKPKSNYSYKQSFTFEWTRNVFMLTLLMYHDFLSYMNIDLEEVFAYYYDSLLRSEYGFPDFFFRASSKQNDYYERCKLLIPELDSLLKQFDFIQRYGEIDYDVFELDSKITDYRFIKSLSDNKFVYLDSEETILFCKLIFCSQSILAFPEKKTNRTNFFEYIRNGISIDDFYDYQKETIESLIQKDILHINVANQLCFTHLTKITIYLLLWQKGYLSTNYMSDTLLKIIEVEVEEKHLKYGNTLFSEQESDYISFVMDNKKFSNALSIRNKITHGSYGKKEESDYKTYYLELLMILVLFTVRINEELDCYARKRDSTEEDISKV